MVASFERLREEGHEPVAGTNDEALGRVSQRPSHRLAKHWGPVGADAQVIELTTQHGALIATVLRGATAL